MLNIHELEQRWLRYKVKSYLPYAAISMSLIVISIVIMLYFQASPKHAILKSEQNQTNIKQNSVAIHTPESVKQKKLPIEKTQQQNASQLVIANVHQQKKLIQKEKLNKEVEVVRLEPSLGFLKKMQTGMQPYYKNEHPQATLQQQKEKKSMRKFQTEIEPPQEQQAAIPQQQQVIHKERVKHISIKRDNTYNDIQEIITRFKKSNNPALSLFVAKKYYELGKYREARNYALMTNNINQNIESSWLIFTKSLVKLGEKQKAIQTLQKYIEYSHSNSAEILLNEIRSGKFR